MSGPKVVNLEAVRRRQQRESLARLRTLHDTAAEWQAALALAGLLTDDIVSENQRLLERLDALRQAEQWSALLNELPARTEFLRNGIDNASQVVIQRTVARRETARRLESTAAMLQRELRTSGSASPELEEILSAGGKADEETFARFESIIQEAFKKLPSRSPPAANGAAQEQLIAAFRVSTQGQSFHEWLAAKGMIDVSEQERNARVARAIGELRLHASGEPLDQLVEKSCHIAVEPDPERRAMLTDSLLLEADELCRATRERVQTLRLIRESIAAFEAFSSVEAAAWVQQLRAALANPDMVAAHELTTAARKWLNEEAAREDAKLRREAVLRGLTALGYEVRENMATAWAEDGRVVVRKPSDPDYGVELTSPPTGAAVQARVVAFARSSLRSVSSAQRDCEVEKTWCGEFQRVRELLVADGFAPTLQHATPAGEVPVKVIVESDSDHRDVSSKSKSSLKARRDRQDER